VTNRSIAVLLAVLGVLLFSSKAIFAKLIYTYDVDAITALMLRMTVAVPVYVVVFLATPKTKSERNKDLLYVFLFGFLGYYLASFLDFEGLTYIKASLERLILFIYPTLVIIISAVFLKKRILFVQKIGVLITYLGVCIVFAPELLEQENPSSILTGAILVFFSALTYAAYLVGSQWLIPRFGVRRFTSMAMIWSGVMVALHYLTVSETPMQMFDLPKPVYRYALMMGVLATVVPSFMISAAIQRLGAAQFSIFGALGPVSTITLAYLFLNETLSFFQILGSLVVIAGVLVAEYYGKKRLLKPDPYPRA
jgi:drug/metabolite transporter (DMT)-like permease